MVPAAGQPVKVGVNGIKVGGNYVYSTSSSPEVFARFPVDSNARSCHGAGRDHRPWVLLRRFCAKEGRVRLLAGNQFMLAVGGSTAAAIDQERSLLNVATSGALEPAKVAAISLLMFPMTPRCIQLFGWCRGGG
ncbi:uncharacterized protein BO72DRAFT_501843 [Aspergillus fijiensis CBS 313.89]|uniref:Uncharacterized protein n=1 Tax=Aspergillus fijiensis CBS 313.89 TaxID=1448319 RepID=A0A8G1VW11_9EURO|nr:uncharacterized protein BO72DRAFT_501843 [Aspergillus fijiensis CBS 313.89]RAK71494.1 hypothetical protein BO72DRAFT_501843 [Aspergillus fijiensis CBS 313.89]